MGAVSGQRVFAHLLEGPTIYLGKEQNAPIVDGFNAGQANATTDNVLRVTSSCVNRLGKDWQAAVACLHALSRCCHPQTGEGVYPNTITFNAAISACEKGGRPDKALQLFEHLLNEGPKFPAPVYPDTITYNAALSAYKMGGQPDKALQLFEDLLNKGPKFPTPVYPDTITYNAALSACEKGGQPDKARQLFKHLLNEGPKFPSPIYPDTITYNAALSACEKGGQPDEALQLFEHLLNEGPKFPTPIYPGTITYSAALSACEKAGRADRYPELLLRGINGVPGRPDTQIFRPSLGFNRALNKLDLHERVALTRLIRSTERNPGVHPAIARAIFHVLLNEPEKILGSDAVGINDKTEFVVGQYGVGSVKAAIAQCMREQGWTPVNPLMANNRPNLGALVVQSQAGTTLAPSATTRLNPFAEEFKPRQRG